MTLPPILFQSEKLASEPVAGVSCAVRVLLVLSAQGRIADNSDPVLAVPGGWQNPSSVRAECQRIIPGLAPDFQASEGLGATDAIDGLAVLADPQASGEIPLAEFASRDRACTRAILAAASRRIIRGTGKATDGVVSQTINRPISQFLSHHLLKLRWMRPIHGTIAASLIGVLMAGCLFFGGGTGLWVGAVLFQLASIIDGVDGEIARATHRSSKLGATLDTAADAATNFAFVAGVSANIWQRGDVLAGQAGFAGLALLVTGLAILGTLSLHAGGPLSFDALKHDAQATSSPVLKWLARVTSRDVYALVLAVLIVAGLAGPAMIAFAAAITIWFAAAMIMLARKAVKR